MEFGLSTDKPAPARKRKEVTSALESHEEYMKLKNVVLSGRMRPMQSAWISMGPEDAKQIGYKWPHRTATDGIRRMIKSMGLESGYEVRKYESGAPGVWVVMVTYTPPMTSAQPRAEMPAQRKPLGRPRKTA